MAAARGRKWKGLRMIGVKNGRNGHRMCGHIWFGKMIYRPEGSEGAWQHRERHSKQCEFRL